MSSKGIWLVAVAFTAALALQFYLLWSHGWLTETIRL